MSSTDSPDIDYDALANVLLPSSKSSPAMPVQEELSEEVTELPYEAPETDGMPEIAKKLSGKQRNAVRLSMTGAKHIDIARALNYTPVNVGLILRSAPGRAFKEYLSGRQDNVFDATNTLIQQNLFSSALRIINTIHDEKADPALRIRCSQDLLDRGGLKPATQVVANISHNVLNEADLKRVREANSFFSAEEQARMDALLLPSGDQAPLDTDPA